MNECFVIQPFDGGEFDQRYKQVLVPAIQASGLQPYRVDDDPAVGVPIEDIEKHIRTSACCIADITMDSPNVWYEVGFAMAVETPLVLICSTARTKFPFDVQHRHIVRYQTGAPSDFEKLKEELTKRIRARVGSNERIRKLGTLTPEVKTEGLTPVEAAALMAVFEEALTPEDSATISWIERAMDASGFTKRAARFGLLGLKGKNLVHFRQDHDYNGNTSTIVSITDQGYAWLLQNQDRFEMHSSAAFVQQRQEITDDDIPF